MNKVYVILYIDKVYGQEPSIEGVVQNQLDFQEWLTKHNEERIENGEIEEDEDDFQLVETPFYTY